MSELAPWLGAAPFLPAVFASGIRALSWPVPSFPARTTFLVWRRSICKEFRIEEVVLDVSAPGQVHLERSSEEFARLAESLLDEAVHLSGNYS